MDLFGTLTDADRGGAVISPCGLYRYRLTRTWDRELRPAAFVMLNPSTADATVDDPTIRRCVGFAKREGCGGIVVVNLFALRSTDPAGLLAAADPVGPDNDRHIREAAEQCHPVIAAWGAHGDHDLRNLHVRDMLGEISVGVMCLGTTKGGHPRHPLYVKGDAPLVPWMTRG